MREDDSRRAQGQRIPQDRLWGHQGSVSRAGVRDLEPGDPISDVQRQHDRVLPVRIQSRQDRPADFDRSFRTASRSVIGGGVLPKERDRPEAEPHGVTNRSGKDTQQWLRMSPKFMISG